MHLDLDKVVTALSAHLHLPVVSRYGAWWGGLIYGPTRRLKYVALLAGHYAKDGSGPDFHIAYDLGGEGGEYPLYDCDARARTTLASVQPVPPTSMGMALWVYPAKRGGVARTSFSSFPNGESHNLSFSHVNDMA